jgi:hypothetical protein
VLNKEAFRTGQFIRLPKELGGDRNDVSAFRVYSSVCLHLWCLWRYVPLGHANDDPSKLVKGSALPKVMATIIMNTIQLCGITNY